jgi:hypothetical protein
MGLELVVRFIDLAQLVTTFTSSAITISRTQQVTAAYTLSVSCSLHQSSNYGLQWQIFPFLGVPKLSTCLSHSSHCPTHPQLLLSHEDILCSESTPFRKFISSQTELCPINILFITSQRGPDRKYYSLLSHYSDHTEGIIVSVIA